jgi:hypothetical protein
MVSQGWSTEAHNNELDPVQVFDQDCSSKFPGDEYCPTHSKDTKLFVHR